MSVRKDKKWEITMEGIKDVPDRQYKMKFMSNSAIFERINHDQYL